jgi:phosphatidylglycerophosphatase A
VVAVTAAGIWASDRMAKSLSDDDPSCVVIDEVAGALLALGLVRGRGWRSELVALLLFRALDIWKPGPIKLSERARPPGLGIMLDDLVAGGLAGVISRML